MATIRGLLNRRGKSKIAQKLGALNVAGAGIDVFTTYAFERAEGAGKMEAAAKGVITGAGWLLAEPLMWGLTIAGGIGSLTEMAVEQSRSVKRQYENIERQAYQDVGREDMRMFHSGERYGTLGGTFVDNEQAATLRQRQMSLLRQHRMATETILGSEARQLHR